jgi:hypothetical protein
MEDSEAGRLPPELWNKVIQYLILNDGFYENPRLIDFLYEIPDASSVAHLHVTRLQDLSTNWRYGLYTALGIMDCVTKSVSAYSFEMLMGSQYIVIKERLGITNIREKYKDLHTTIDYFYRDLRYTTKGIQFRAESRKFPRNLLLIYPLWDEEARQIRMRTFRAKKLIFDRGNRGYYTTITVIFLDDLYTATSKEQKRFSYRREGFRIAEHGSDIMQSLRDKFGDELGSKVYHTLH